MVDTAWEQRTFWESTSIDAHLHGLMHPSSTDTLSMANSSFMIVAKRVSATLNVVIGLNHARSVGQRIGWGTS